MRIEKKDKISQLKAEENSLFKKQIISYLCALALIAITVMSLLDEYKSQIPFFKSGWFLILDTLASIVALAFMYGVSNRRKDIQKELEKETAIMDREEELEEEVLC